MNGFLEQLQKEALTAPVSSIMSSLARPGRLHAMQAGMGSGMGLGLGAGLLGGGALGGVKAYRQARAEGASPLSAVGSTLGGVAHGALRGGVTGVALGAGGGALLGAAAPTQVISATKQLAKMPGKAGEFSRFGQRQVHSVTGWKPGGATASIEQIGAGAHGARETAKGALASLGKSPEMDALVAAHSKGPAEVAAARQALQAVPGAKLTQAHKALRSAETSQQMGLTSLPGYAKSIGKNGLIPTVATGVKEQWQASGPKGKAMMLALPAISAAGTLKAPDQPGGRGKGETIGRLAGSTLGSLAAPMSLTGGLLLGSAFEHAGGAMGKGVDKLRGRRPAVPQDPTPPPATAPGDTGQAAVEHVYGTGYGGAGGLE